jgi:F-type H+-transporting ATPase subunit b
LGINPLLIVAQIVSFLILFWLFKKFLYGKIEAALTDRRESVKKIFKDKEEIETRLLNVEKELAEKRKEMQKLGTQIESEAKKAAEEIRKQILAKAEAESGKEIEKATERIRQEAENAKDGLKAEIKELARKIAEKTIGQEAGKEKWQRAELDKSKKRLAGIKPEEK